MKCPGCGAHNPTDDHLMKEYLDLQRASFDRMFGHNARKARDEVSRMLHARGITEIPNLFGPIKVEVSQ